MIFYKRITICNLFAYYGKQSIEFNKHDGKPLYLIYGNNGFGKTSFIRSMKLLFLGSGLNKNNQIPLAISNFVDKNPGRFTPRNFLIGTGGEKTWEGALNKKACSESNSEYFMELVLEQDGKEIVIKRSWRKHTDAQGRLVDLQEKFSFKQDDRIFWHDEAEERCETLLPSQFVDFFIFDGEEIEAMAEEIGTSLKDKIQNMLNISVLDILISQTKKLNNELTKQNFDNEEDKIKFDALKSNIDTQKRNKILIEKEINTLLEQLSDLQKDKKDENEKRDKLIKNSGKEEAKIQRDIETAQANIEEAKNHIKSNQEEILFIGLDGFMDEICKKLADISNVSNLSQLELEKLCDFSAEYLHENHYKDISSATLARQLKDTFDKFVTKNSQDKIFGSIPGLAKVDAIYKGTKTNQKLFSDAILRYKVNTNDLKELQRRLDDILENQSMQDKIKFVEETISNLENQIIEIQDKISSRNQSLTDFNSNIMDNEREIIILEDKIKRDDRINEKLNITKILIENIEKYKQERIKKVTNELKDKVLAYYKKLIINDNVCSIEIDNFALFLKNADNEIISVKNQSAGQKQAISISIFWALSDLSGRCFPLIIDTPLARMDSTNRANIIQNYYFNSSNQIIVLPHDGEFGYNEYEIAKDKIASTYQIKNSNDRSSAYIKSCDIDEILGE